MNILLVDDEMDQLHGLRIGLRSRGHRVLKSSSAEEAMECMKNAKTKIEMIITDYLLPGMDGLELVKAIRTRDQIVPIILVTAHGGKDLVVNALRSGCDGYIEKPFTLDELMQEVDRIKMAVTIQDNDSGGQDGRLN